MKNQILANNTRSAQIMYDLKDKNLTTHSEAQKIMDLIADGNLINILADSKATKVEIKVRRAESEVSEKEIEITLELFKQVASRASLVYYVLILTLLFPCIRTLFSGSKDCFQRL